MAERGLPFEWAALREGGPRNGVLTAIEDFMAGREGLRLAVIPLFFGCGLIWPRRAVGRRGRRDRGPWDRNPVLERIERVRVTQLIQRHSREQEIDERIERPSGCAEAVREGRPPRRACVSLGVALAAAAAGRRPHSHARSSGGCSPDEPQR